MTGPWATRARKLALGVAAVLLFILALELIKEGAREVGFVVRDVLYVTNAANAMGFGWILAGVVLSGSPAAAISLALYASGVVDAVQTLLMITGSRLGASLVILAISVLYHMRGKKESTSLEVGILAVLVTFTIYLPAAVVGWLLIESEVLAGMRLGTSEALVGFLDVVYGPIVATLDRFLPTTLVAAGGVLLLIGSIALFDKALPEVERMGKAAQAMVLRVFRPVIAFAVGALITAFTLSVSVSLGLLVPLAHKGYVRRENLVPYIMGANLTTFVDTLFAALLVNAPGAFTIVLAQVVSVGLVSFFILFAMYQSYEHTMLRALERLLASRALLVALTAILVLLPVALMLYR